MSLADALAATPVRQRGPVCTVGALLASLDADDAATLAAALADDAITASRLAAALRAVGHRVSDHTVGRHRRGDCCCGAR